MLQGLAGLMALPVQDVVSDYVKSELALVERQGHGELDLEGAACIMLLPGLLGSIAFCDAAAALQRASMASAEAWHTAAWQATNWLCMGADTKPACAEHLTKDKMLRSRRGQALQLHDHLQQRWGGAREYLLSTGCARLHAVVCDTLQVLLRSQPAHQLSACPAQVCSSCVSTHLCMYMQLT